MTRTKRSKETNLAIRDFVTWFYSQVLGNKPDVTNYKAGYKILDPLMASDELLPDKRIYTCDELKTAIDYLIEHNITVRSLAILYYPDLVRAIVDHDAIVLPVIIKRLREEQKEFGIEPLHEVIKLRPEGW